MKRLIVPVLVLLSVVISCTLENAGNTRIFKEDFEVHVRADFPWSYASGNGVAGSQTGGIGDNITNEGIAAVEPGQENWALRFNPDSPNPRGTQLNFKSLGGGEKATFTFDWYIAGTTGTGRLAVQDSTTFSPGSAAFDSAVYSNMFIVFEILNNKMYHYMGNIKDFQAVSDIAAEGTLDDGSGRYQQIEGIVMNKWYTVTVVVNFYNKTVAYEFIDKVTEGIVVPMQAYKFDKSVGYLSQMASIRFFSNGANWQPYIDNVELSGSPVDTSGYYDGDIPHQPGYTNDTF